MSAGNLKFRCCFTSVSTLREKTFNYFGQGLVLAKLAKKP